MVLGIVHELDRRKAGPVVKLSSEELTSGIAGGIDGAVQGVLDLIIEEKAIVVRSGYNRVSVAIPETGAVIDIEITVAKPGSKGVTLRDGLESFAR